MTNYYVKGTGADTNNGTTDQTPFATFAKANNLVQPGDTIYIMGNCVGNLILTKSGTSTAPITISGYNSAGSTFNDKVYPANYTLGTGATKSTVLYKSGIYGVKTDYNNFIVIKDLEIYGFENGIRTAGWNIKVEHCKVHDCFEGIIFWAGSWNSTALNCTVYRIWEHGIARFAHTTSTLTSGFTVDGCTVYDCGHNNIDCHTNCKNIIIQNNDIYFTAGWDDQDFGIKFHNGGIQNVLVKNNHLHNCRKPIEVVNVDGIIIEDNVIEDVGNSDNSHRAILLATVSTDNTPILAANNDYGVKNCIIRNNEITNSYLAYMIIPYYGYPGKIENLVIQDNIYDNVTKKIWWAVTSAATLPIAGTESIGDHLWTEANPYTYEVSGGTGLNPNPYITYSSLSTGNDLAITAFSPSDLTPAGTEHEVIYFNVTTNMTCDVVWTVNGSAPATDSGVTASSHGFSLGIGTWTILATASASGQADATKQWIVTVTAPAPPEPTTDRVTIIQLSGGTYAATSAHVPEEYELVVMDDKNMVAIGDGTKAVSSLPYISAVEVYVQTTEPTAARNGAVWINPSP